MRKLSRKIQARKLLVRNLIVSLLHREHLTTTQTRAFEVARALARLEERVKTGDLAARRAALDLLPRWAAAKLIEYVIPRKEPGGLIKLERTGHRPGDAAPLVTMSLRIRKRQTSLEGEAKAPQKEKRAQGKRGNGRKTAKGE